MAMRDLLLFEFDQEMANTRKMLERAPEDRFNYKPHAKSFKIERLAGHVAELPTWALHTMETQFMEIEPGQFPPFIPANSRDLLAHFDEQVRLARAAIASASEEDLMAIWTMKWQGRTVVSMPRISVLRFFVLNHMIHHRAQLGVYLRLLDVQVPGMYGPSADEAPFSTFVEKTEAEKTAVERTDKAA
jgi:uncharacterized damage-inducible protein DinB